ncbi:hypothetical protein IEU95_07395 [Hoyosella rhizosphaerae]|uniref:Uncharacterized protein n=1 Tax=Hoyosella rhizosphaerae TaxID=1755582 RepID=A0A916U346_9ACTN|nr:hypothetical protein [Hoyosella rhizosphaerae]MBN4926648.1 hypothetical protein [Hoyosella rhizosphaerae]GGC57578.1 hypothetical protein GCM10011410_07600 [Hoyosella rhizosphaerae]
MASMKVVCTAVDSIESDDEREAAMYRIGDVLLRPMLDQHAKLQPVADRAGADVVGLVGVGYGLFASVRWVAELVETWTGRGMPKWPRWRKYVTELPRGQARGARAAVQLAGKQLGVEESTLRR